MNLRKMEKGVRMLLEGMGVKVDDDNYRETPQRVARMYAEMLAPPDVSLKTFPTDHKEMVLVRNHVCWGVCPHHLLPIKYRVSLGYVPSERALGLSKLPRLANLYTYTPMLQEDYTHRLADTFLSKTKAMGLGVVVIGEHGCMGVRGVRTDAQTITSAMRGVFLEKPEARAEFLSLLSL